MSKLRRMAVAALVVVLTLAGCSSEQEAAPASPPEPTYPNWPTLMDNLRFRWTAEPGIDLLTGAAVPIRAYLESRWVAEVTYDYDPSPDTFSAYPGFFNAVKEPVGTPREGPDPVEVWYAWPRLPAPSVVGHPLYGNGYFHVLSLEPIEGGRRAYVCDGRYDIFTKSRGEQGYESILDKDYVGKYDFVHIWRVEVRYRGELPTRAPQRGPNPAPVEDVFGAVEIFASDRAQFGGFEGQPFPDERSRIESRISEENHRACLDRMPDTLHDMGVIAAERPAEPPAFLPAVPGWPAQAS